MFIVTVHYWEDDGGGGNDCWQNDNVLIESAKVYEDESK